DRALCVSARPAAGRGRCARLGGSILFPMTGHDHIRPGAAADRLAEAIEQTAPICIGIDPVLERLPAELQTAPAPEAFERFGLMVLDAIGGIAGVVKFQSACYERWGSAGVAALERGVRAARDRGFV